NKSITMVKNENNLLPMQKNQDILITGPSLGKPSYLADQMADKGYNVTGYATNTSPAQAQIDEAVLRAQDADTVVVTTYTANTNITMVKNVNKILPKQKNQDILITGPSLGKPSYLADQMADKGYNVTGYATNTSPAQAQIDEAVIRAQDADTVVVTTYTANTNTAQQQLVSALQSTGKDSVVSAIRNPDALMKLREVEWLLGR